MPHTNQLLSSLRERLRVLDVEREALVRLVEMYSENAATEAAAPIPVKAPESAPAPYRTRQRGGRPHNPFAPIPGGATERIREVLKVRPGLKYGELVEAVLTAGLTSSSKDPKRALGSTISGLVARQVIRRDKDGRHFLM